MMKRTCVSNFSNRQAGQHAFGGTYSSILSIRPEQAEAQEHVKFGSEHMEPGVQYAPSDPGYLTKVKPVLPRSESLISGLTHETVPSKLLSLDLVFDKVEKGDIRPRRYIAEIVEPISADPEKHPIPILPWWHKSHYAPRPLSYSLDLTEVPTEGAERNPFYHVQNPQCRIHSGDKKKKSDLAYNRTTHWIRRVTWWYRGRRRQPNYVAKVGKKMGTNPWFSAVSTARWITDGQERLNPGTTPHYAYWKFLPVLGWNGYGTKEGEICVEDRYTTVGLDEIQWWVDTGMLNVNETITPNTLIESRLVADYHWPGLKLVTNNCSWFKAQVDIEMESADPEAVKIVRQNGGDVVTRWRDEEALAKEKSPWRYPVIGKGKLPPEELIRDLYSNEQRGGYLSHYYQEKLRVRSLDTPREWSLSEKTPASVGELRPPQEEQVAVPNFRRAVQVSLQRKQETWDDMLAGTHDSAESRMGRVTQKPFPMWEYTYFYKQGHGHTSKREPPEGQEVVFFPGYPYRDSRYFNWVVDAVGSMLSNKMTPSGTVENVYEATEMDRVKVEKKKPWELRGEGWRTEADAEVRYRNPYNNPYLKERIDAWAKKEKERRATAKKLGLDKPNT
eukprot:TRINITY_DN18838_c0_g1_i1.p1 TRINITY_DN18838_c0_g1~~TRINITY_DN18838_c0_g1_i1.p1  ORF type:complete len:615 (+),score=189.58 TRINITY_DN18838_c0_g1_i1:54-1898(+)